MQKVIQKKLQILKLKGYRKSNLRPLILEILLDSQVPLNAKNILQALKKYGEFPNKTTVYREIETLTKEKIIQEVDLYSGAIRYEIIPEDGHRHHLICSKCGIVFYLSPEKIQKLEKSIQKLEKEVEFDFSFLPVSHTFQIKGICAKCQAENR